MIILFLRRRIEVEVGSRIGDSRLDFGGSNQRCDGLMEA